MRALVVASTLAVVVLASPGVALAQEEPSSSDVAAARALGQEGVKLADSGNCAEAVDRLARAEKMYHAPTTLARLGECQVQLGKLVEGTENLNRVVREQLAPGAPAAFAAAQERAKKVLEEAKPKIAKLKIAVAAPADAQITVKVDGENIPLANLNMNRPIDPGEHTVDASAPGYKPASAKVKLAEGANDSIALTLEPDPNAPKTAPPPAASSTQTQASSTQKQPQGDSGSSRIPAYAAFGVGVIGLGVGTVTGLMATSKKSDLESACDDNGACPESSRDTLDSGKTLGTISTVGFVVGAVGIAAGVVLYLTSGPSTSTRASASANGFRIRF
jgi:hypothetical protein